MQHLNKPQKLTENEVVLLLKRYLEDHHWEVGDRYCLGNTRGWDLEARKGPETLLVEAKGARAGDKAPTKRRHYFNGGQIKTHFGRALVTVLEAKAKHPGHQLAIAHPDDLDIRKAIGPITPFLAELGIRHFWVSRESVMEE